jgi:tetratricopeptide (TPR) repeat protein
VSKASFDFAASPKGKEQEVFTPVAGHRAPAALPLAAADSAQTSARAIDRLSSAMESMKSAVLRDKLGRAIAALRADNIDEAAKLSLEFLQDEPENAMGLRVLANTRERVGDFANAFLAYQFAYNLEPKADGILGDLGRAAFFMNQMAEAETLFRAQLDVEPDDVDALNNLACTLRDQLRLDEALETLRAGATAHPKSALLWNNLGTVMSALGDAERSLVFFDEAVRLDPDYAKAIYNRANLKVLINDLKGAKEDAQKALTLTRLPTDAAMMRLSLSLILLASGRIKEGWEAYEARRNPQFADYTHYPIDRPLWTPQDPLDGKTLLLIGEQGLGDEVMFSSMFPDLLKALGPKGRLILALEPRLRELYQRSFPGVEIGDYLTGGLGFHTLRIVPFLDERWDEIDYWAPLGAPLRRFRSRLKQFPKRRGFLTPDPSRVAHWRVQLAKLGPTPKIGVLWKSLINDAVRSKHFASFLTWSPVLSLQGVRLVNLQYGDCEAELAAAQAAGIDMWTPPGIDLKNDLDDLAALTVALDLVVGPSNATTNIAAACGGAVTLVSMPGAWPQLGTPSWPWYPQLTVHTAEKCGVWDSAIEALAADIRLRFGLAPPSKA